jgi:hypothetical protein
MDTSLIPDVSVHDGIENDEASEWLTETTLSIPITGGSWGDTGRLDLSEAQDLAGNPMDPYSEDLTLTPTEEPVPEAHGLLPQVQAPADNEPPRVVAVEIPGPKTDAPSKIVLTFSEPMNMDIAPGWILWVDDFDAEGKDLVRWDGSKTLVVSLAESGARWRDSVSLLVDGAEDLAGNPMVKFYREFWFVPADASVADDFKSPAIRSVSMPGSSESEPSGIVLTFSEPMDPKVFPYVSVQLGDYSTSGTDVGVWTGSRTLVVPLAETGVHWRDEGRLTVSLAKDIAGNTMVPYVDGFLTLVPDERSADEDFERPTVVSVRGGGSSGSKPSEIVITFSESMDTEAPLGLSVGVGELWNKGQKDGHWSSDSTELVFSLDGSNVEWGDSGFVWIWDAKDLAGNLIRPYSDGFIVVPTVLHLKRQCVTPLP